jgi:hypothetical protein
MYIVNRENFVVKMLSYIADAKINECMGSFVQKYTKIV